MTNAKVIIQEQIKIRQQAIVDKLMTDKHISQPVQDVINSIVNSDLIQSVIVDSLPLKQKEEKEADKVIDSTVTALKIAESLPESVISAINNVQTDEQKADIIYASLTENKKIASDVKDALRECSCSELTADILRDFPNKNVDWNTVNDYLQRADSKYAGECNIPSREYYLNCLRGANINLPGVEKTSSEFYYPEGQFAKAFDYFVKSGIDVDELMKKVKFPPELQAEKDKVTFLWKEAIATKELYGALKYFTDFNLDVDGIMKWYAENDKEFGKLLSENQKVVYIFSQELDEMLEKLDKAEAYFATQPKEYYERLKEIHKHDNDYRWIMDTKTISLNEKGDILKILLYELDKDTKKNIALSKFKAKFKKAQLEKQDRAKMLEFGKADAFFKRLTIASMNNPSPNISLINEEQQKLYDNLFSQYSDELASYNNEYDKVVYLYKLFQDYLQINRISDSDIARADEYFQQKGVGYLYSTPGDTIYKQLLAAYEKNPLIVAINISSLPYDEKIKYLKYAVYQIDNRQKI